MIENIDGGTARSHEGDMQWPARLCALTNPEGRFAALEVGCLPGAGEAMAAPWSVSSADTSMTMP
jgi:hypothetical protein